MNDGQALFHGKGGKKMKSNPNFVCAMCGAEDMPGAVGSTLILPAGYGSLHDMERMAIPLCGRCCDRLFAELIQLLGATVESPW